MQETTENALVRAPRLVLRSPTDGPAAVASTAQEVPSGAPTAPDRAAFARQFRGAMDARFADLNPCEGRLVPSHRRPAGAIWRFHPAGAPVAPVRSGALA